LFYLIQNFYFEVPKVERGEINAMSTLLSDLVTPNWLDLVRIHVDLELCERCRVSQALPEFLSMILQFSGDSSQLQFQAYLDGYFSA
jgi:hypothetical protein